MEVSEFNKHIDSLIQQKYPGLYPQTISTESVSKINNSIEIVQRKDIPAFNRACLSDYEPLARDIAKIIIQNNELNLAELYQQKEYMMHCQLKTICEVICQITDKEKVSYLLKTANKSQLEYFISNRELPVSIKEQAKNLLTQRTNNIGHLNKAKECLI